MLELKLHDVFQSRFRKDSDSCFWQDTFTGHMQTHTKGVDIMQGGVNCIGVGLREEGSTDVTGAILIKGIKCAAHTTQDDLCSNLLIYILLEVCRLQ